jgi:hypothetical protein
LAPLRECRLWWHGGFEPGPDPVTHDIAAMVGYTLAVHYPDRMTKRAVIDEPLAGIGPLESPRLRSQSR